MSVRFSHTVELASPDLEELIRRVTAMKWLFPFLAGLWLVFPAVAARPSHWQWTAGAGVGLGTVGFLAIAIYEHNRFSVRALILMKDTTALSLGLLLVGMEELFRITSRAASRLIYEYWHVCAAVAVATFVFGTLWPAWARNGSRQTTEFRSYLPQGTITAAEVFEILMRAKGARAAFRSWPPARFAAIMGPVVLAITALQALGYYPFMLAVLGMVVGALLAGTGAGHLVRYLRGMGLRDLEICFLAPPPPHDREYWNARVSENYQALGKLMRFGLYAELAVYVIFGLMSSLGGRTPWPLLACIATWALGSALVLLRNRHGISRDAGQVGWVLIHFPLLLVCVRCVLGIFS